MARNVPQRPIRLHRFALSGHCHRVELLLRLLELPYETIEVNLAAGDQRKPEFLALNPFGQVPVIEDGTVVVSDSNAILTYLAEAYAGARFRLNSPALLAEQQRWFSVAAGPLDEGPATARAMCLFGRAGDLERPRARAHALFRVLNAHLESRAYLVGSELTLADLAIYSYAAHAPEGGVSLAEHPHLRAWLQRVESTPRFVGLPRSPVPET
jgi:glutathione S-transferase